MATTYSTSLKLTLIGDGLDSGTWGQTTNTNLGTLLEQAITGYVAINMADANVTLTTLNGTFDQARNAVIELTGTNSAVRDVIPPVVEKLYTIYNNTAGGYAIRVIGSTGTGVTIPNGVTALVYCNGTNFYAGLSGTSGNFAVNGNLTATGVSAATGTFSGTITAVSPTFTGTVTVPTPSPGDNTTKAATTAFVTTAVNAATAALGTMSTQNANNVNITGGTISGLNTGIPVASGGTGRTNLAANNLIVGNGTSAVGVIPPGTNGSVLTSNGSAWVAGIPTTPTSGSGGLGNGTTFSISTGASGVALITVEFLSLASYGNFGGATGYLYINGGYAAEKYTQTIEYSSRNSGCGGVILYRLVGAANTNYTGQFTWGGAGYLHSASYMFIGI